MSVARLVAMAPGGTMNSLARHDTLPDDCSLIVPGEFGGPGGFTDLLFYRQGFAMTNGFGQFYATEAQGAIKLLAEYNTFWAHWTHIVPGNFGGDGLTDLFYYSAGQGLGWFWAMQPQGQMTPIGSSIPLAPGYTHVVPGKWGGPGDFTDLFFYSRPTGMGWFVRVGEGGAYEGVGVSVGGGWGGVLPVGTDWTHIVPGHFGGPADITDLFFYGGGSGKGLFVSMLQQDAPFPYPGTVLVPQELRSYTTFGKDWTHIVPGNFGGPEDFTDLLFYAGGTRRGSFWAMRAGGDMEEIRTYNSFRPDWIQIVPGEFGGDGLTDLLFYRTPPIYVPDPPPVFTVVGGGPETGVGTGGTPPPPPPPPPLPSPIAVTLLEVKSTPQRGDFAFTFPPDPRLTGMTITSVRNLTRDKSNTNLRVDVSHLGRGPVTIGASATSSSFNGLAIPGAWSGNYTAGEFIIGTDAEVPIRLLVTFA